MIYSGKPRKSIELMSLVQGDLWWYKNANRHRDYDLPAEILEDGSMGWWNEGFRHRDGKKPAFTTPDGYCEYWYKGKLHENY